ncbi:hypothetical protein B4U79_18446 [Dinothrombium tinctorium]|uniref:NTR domain-containing protein n=1 Tax=Dinothrombium tinctorium TaxID=1965070 RepID=A0A3S3PJE3_9ACAR|nr:hypothetical protein B4U79_18539 [Dinothrombium tinctorium]RWS02418.1 hypothetical protein B4U79_18485 [Dinothrombium tinctorium]RWS03164.1 hypothetical protein B4U79_18446 [Dinothrombium tinctorium]
MSNTQKFCRASIVLSIRVGNSITIANLKFYDVIVDEVLNSKRNATFKSATVVSKNGESACGIRLKNNGRYLITGQHWRNIISSTACDFKLNLDAATESTKREIYNLFKTRLNCNVTLKI